jgi:hypothetical protein
LETQAQSRIVVNAHRIKRVLIVTVRMHVERGATRPPGYESRPFPEK